MAAPRIPGIIIGGGASVVTGNSEPSLLRFGVFDLDPKSGELRKAGVEINLPPQPAKVLVLLATRAGQLVSREELRQQVWGKETFVDFEHGLNSCIKQIRAALDDHPENPRYIETRPRRGYRFIAPVQEVPPRAVTPGAPSEGLPTAALGIGPRRYSIAIVALVLALFATGYFTRLAGTRPRAGQRPAHSGPRSDASVGGELRARPARHPRVTERRGAGHRSGDRPQAHAPTAGAYRAGASDRPPGLRALLEGSLLLEQAVGGGLQESHPVLPAGHCSGLRVRPGLCGSGGRVRLAGLHAQCRAPAQRGDAASAGGGAQSARARRQPGGSAHLAGVRADALRLGLARRGARIRACPPTESRVRDRSPLVRVLADRTGPGRGRVTRDSRCPAARSALAHHQHRRRGNIVLRPAPRRGD